MVSTELRQSPISGIGVFMLAPVKKGQCVWHFDPRIDRPYTRDELKSLPEPARSFIELVAPWDEQAGIYLLCGDNAKYTNHSENPTAATTGPGVFTDDVATRDLPAGTELTVNYYDFYDNKDVLARMELKG